MQVRMEVKKIDIGETTTKWFVLNGFDFGMGIEFDNDVFGITPNNVILDCENYPMSEDDGITMAVRNSLI